MKRFILVIFVLAVVFPPFLIAGASSVKATGELRRVITDDTPFFSSTTSNTPLFYLPYTYYVRVLGDTGVFCHVEVYGDFESPALDGFVPSEMLFSDGLSTATPFLSLSIRTASTAVLYADSTLTQPLQYVFADRNMKYYGKISSTQGIAYYVSYNDRLGYVKEESVYPFTIPNHPNELTFLIPETPPEEPKEEAINEDFFGLKIIIIVCLIFAGVIALFVALGKKPNTSHAPSYYDDNEYQ